MFFWFSHGHKKHFCVIFVGKGHFLSAFSGFARRCSSSWVSQRRVIPPVAHYLGSVVILLIHCPVPVMCWAASVADAAENTTSNGPGSIISAAFVNTAAPRFQENAFLPPPSRLSLSFSRPVRVRILSLSGPELLFSFVLDVQQSAEALFPCC